MEIIIGYDIRKYKVKDIGPFTFKEAISLAVGAGCGYGAWALEKALLDNVEPLFIIIAAAPALLFGFFKIHGLSLWNYIKTAFFENVVSPKVRPYVSDFKCDARDFVTEEEYKEYYSMEPKPPVKYSKEELAELKKEKGYA